VAVPVPVGRKNIPRYKDVKKLLGRLETGLILVRFLKTKTKVEVVLHPKPFSPRKAKRRRASILREIDGRYSEFNRAGSATGDRKVSAYKQQALYIAHTLKETGQLSPAELKKKGGGNKTQQILAGNVYGWFDRVSRGVYRVNDAGLAALELYSEIVSQLLDLPIIDPA
jgi:hypothetical protein